MANKMLQYLVIGFLLFTILESAYLFYQVDKMTPSISEEYRGTAAASGIVSLCLNDQPDINLTPCNNTLIQNQSFTCTVNATELDGDSLTFNSSFITNTTLFNITAGGVISFTPGTNDVGNHTVEITVTENSTCTNNFDAANYTFNVTNINDAPILDLNLDNISYEENQTIRPFFLNNHFSDPDGDTLTYSVSGVDEANVTILGTSEVVVNSLTCDFQDLVLFTATDPFNLTATSNPVIITCTPEATAGSGGGASSSAGGGAGGGGGGGGSLSFCRSNFECMDYTECTPDNNKTQRCIDLNGCEEPEFITLQCNYEYEQTIKCQEDWLCGDWGTCLINNSQYRECIDISQCGTEFSRPPSMQSCVYVPTCNDGVKNGDEIGIDCGGSCPQCLVIETPGPIEEGASLLTTILTLLILVLLLCTLAYKYAHRQVYQVLARMGLHFAGRVEKQILLDDRARDDMLAILKNIETEYTKEPINELQKEYVTAAKSYFFHALGLEEASDKEDLLAMCEERKLNEHLVKVLASFFDKTLNIEFSTEALDGYELMYLVEELKEVVLQTSEYNNDMLQTTITEYKVPDNLYPLEKMRLKFVNAYIALHFNELEAAAHKYMQILHEYEDLSEQEKDIIYNELGRLFQKIRYRAAWIENM